MESPTTRSRNSQPGPCMPGDQSATTTESVGARRQPRVHTLLRHKHVVVQRRRLNCAPRRARCSVKLRRYRWAARWPRESRVGFMRSTPYSPNATRRRPRRSGPSGVSACHERSSRLRILEVTRLQRQLAVTSSMPRTARGHAHPVAQCRVTLEPTRERYHKMRPRSTARSSGSAIR